MLILFSLVLAALVFGTFKFIDSVIDAEEAAHYLHAHTATCKFCEYTGSDFRDCENGSIYDDEGDFIDVSYCGNLACPRCFSCQGNEATPERIEAGRFTRAVTEGRYEREQQAGRL